MIGGQPIYVLDTNVFVEAARHYYAFDIVPRFWHSLIEQAGTGQIQSIDRVKAEIDRYEDDLKAWANSSFHSWFASTDEDEVNDAYRRIIEWATKQKEFTTSAKAEISRGDNADAWLVAMLCRRTAWSSLTNSTHLTLKLGSRFRMCARNLVFIV